MSTTAPTSETLEKNKPMVLCITRTALQAFGIPNEGHGLYDIDLSAVHNNDFHLLNRHVVDNKNVPEFMNIAYQLPQILPYISVTDGNGSYLSYSRNGTETRLHGSLSIGVGGHVDFVDLLTLHTKNHDFVHLIQQACARELVEEVGMDEHHSPSLPLNKLILDTTNSVGKVHVGFFSQIIYPQANPQEELHNAEWLSVSDMMANIDSYENWSQILIKHLAQS